jgi:hypothetical protein
MEWVSWQGDRRNPCGGGFRRGASGERPRRDRVQGVHMRGMDKGQSGTLQGEIGHYLRDNRCSKNAKGLGGGARAVGGVSPSMSGRGVGLGAS